MRTYKTIDFFLQVFVLVAAIVSILIIDAEQFDGSIFILIFVVIQIISLLIHTGTGLPQWKMVKWRKIHAIGTSVVILVILIAFIQGSIATSGGDKDDKYRMDGLGTLFIALIPAILMALFYTIICVREWLNIRNYKNEY